MSTTKSSGTAKNMRDSNPKYLGVKLSDGQKAKPGQIIIRQRGTKFLAGKNVGIGKDHTLFALTEGIVQFLTKKKKKFDGSARKAKEVNVVSS
jgi:large subunit ribosomal protein L27